MSQEEGGEAGEKGLLARVREGEIPDPGQGQGDQHDTAVTSVCGPGGQRHRDKTRRRGHLEGAMQAGAGPQGPQCCDYGSGGEGGDQRRDQGSVTVVHRPG